MHASLILAVLAASAVLAPVDALAAGAPKRLRSLERLTVRNAVLDADRGRITLEVRCTARHADCAGLLRATSFDGVPITAGRRVELGTRRWRRVILRLRRGGLQRFAESTNEQLADVDLVGRRRTLIGGVEGGYVLRVRLSCRSGETLAADAHTRLFRLRGFGVHACGPGDDVPVPVTQEDFGLTYDTIEIARVAGSVVGFVSRAGFKCGGSSVTVFDLRVRRVVRSSGSGQRVSSSANGCDGSS